ncbi:galactose-binding lectin l-1-like [Phlebotomus argentipes]|uniref:galactose-binding lectin l-1-like n=1 Tax=Phlebotomus argentipes TaxID=94469 RepID=UPI002892A0FB|nr:galactose-binding lectin l-1-like [Phlebotomus argentipes]
MLSLVLPKKISTNDEIVIEGSTLATAKKFSVNFVINNDNIPLHMRTEFGTTSSQDRVVLNHKVGGIWQKEFTDIVSWTRPSQRFQVSFLFNRESIIIYENDSFLASFTHKLDISQTQSIQIWDDLEQLDRLSFKYSSRAARSADCGGAQKKA